MGIRHSRRAGSLDESGGGGLFSQLCTLVLDGAACVARGGPPCGCAAPAGVLESIRTFSRA